MHIPDHTLNAAICSAAAGISSLGLAMAAHAAVTQTQKPSLSKFAAVTAVVIAVQALNFPVGQTMSGHCLGGLLAAVYLGIPFGILAMSLAIALQAFLLGDGGISALGANILNMAIIGVGLGGWLRDRFVQWQYSNACAVSLAAFASFLTAVGVMGIELAIPLTRGLSEMISSHLGTAVLEAITAGIVIAWKDSPFALRLSPGFVLALTILGTAVLNPLSSKFPDAMSVVIEKYSAALPNTTEQHLSKRGVLNNGTH